MDGSVACCRRVSPDGLVDCANCLEGGWALISDSLTHQERALATEVLAIVREAGEQGIMKSDLQAKFGASGGHHNSIIRKLMESPVPLLFWTGYTSLVLVSSAFLKNWTVQVSDSPVIRVAPRRWLDISGLKVVNFWEAALRAVIGVIIFRPGISQAELRWRLRSVYDRQEVSDVLRFLQEEGFVEMRCDTSVTRDESGIAGAIGDQEEKGVFWFIGDEKRWFQV